MPLRRVVFHEITPEAVQEAFDHPRDIDMKLVDAQQARRVLDRLVGYQLSPFLWKKVRRGLSAGRVQSVAVRLVVEREREIQGFVPQEYWTIDARAGEGRARTPTFQREAGRATPARRSKLEVTERRAGRAHRRRPAQSAAYQVLSVQHEGADAPPGGAVHHQHAPAGGLAPPRLHRQANDGGRPAALRGRAARAREGEVGLITYMRTDSTNVAASAQQEARDYIADKFGKEFLPTAAPRLHARR